MPSSLPGLTSSLSYLFSYSHPRLHTVEEPCFWAVMVAAIRSVDTVSFPKKHCFGPEMNEIKHSCSCTWCLFGGPPVWTGNAPVAVHTSAHTISTSSAGLQGGRHGHRLTTQDIFAGAEREASTPVLVPGAHQTLFVVPRLSQATHDFLRRVETSGRFSPSPLHPSPQES